VRDGIELAMTVRLPPGRTLADGPFPTLVEYSGYQVAAPGDLLGSLAASLSGRAAPADPLLPATATLVGAVVAPLLDFAVVSVQMRGSGCSGGAFDLFDLPTTFDGYDAVETVAAQPWVKGGKVGMAGISFSGITQLFTAGTRPPHLAAIAPMSVTDDTYSATGFPGGIRNSGFARSWLRDRVRDARPAPAGGQPYARALVRAGDRRCRANQRLRLQSVDALALSEDEPYRDPALFEPRAPATWMERIDVPTFLVGQFHDEQTGAHFAESLGRLRRNEKVWVTLQNGVHVDALGPDVLTRWVEFLKLYVAEEVPVVPALRPRPQRRALPLPGRVAGRARAAVALRRHHGRGRGARAFERDPAVRVLMDNGAGPQGPGSIGAAWELGFAAWPPPQARPATLFLGAGGTLAPAPRPGRDGELRRRTRAPPGHDAARHGRGRRLAGPAPYDWRPVAAGRARASCPRRSSATSSSRAPRAWTCACAPPPATPTCRSPSARSGPTGRRPTCRAAGCARRIAPWIPVGRPCCGPCRRTARRTPPRFPRAGTRACGCRSCPWPTPSARARACG
jgi:predicted acyl esterase